MGSANPIRLRMVERARFARLVFSRAKKSRVGREPSRRERDSADPARRSGLLRALALHRGSIG